MENNKGDEEKERERDALTAMCFVAAFWHATAFMEVVMVEEAAS